LRAPHHFPSEQGAVTLHFDVDVIFEHQRDHILGRQVQVAGLREGVEAGRVRQIDGRNAAGFIVARQPARAVIRRRVDSNRGLRRCGTRGQRENKEEADCSS
jgi:hypothetical protein